MSKKFTICIDMDDTITTLVTPWILWLNKKHGYNVDPKDVNQWEIPPFFPGLSDHEVFQPFWEPEFWDTVRPKLNSVYWVRKLIEDGHDVYICTNTHYKVASMKMEKVLFKYFPFLSNRNLIIMRNKQMIKCDYLIDDGPHNIIGDYKGLLMDMPHNHNFYHPDVIRVFDWEAIYNIISMAANH